MLKLKKLALTGLILSGACSHSSPQVSRDMASQDKQNKAWFEKTNIFYSRLLTFNKKSAEAPVETFERLRADKPILKLSKLPVLFPGHDLGKTYFIAKRTDVIDILSHPEVFSVRFYSKKIQGPVGPHMLATDNKEYNLIEKPWMRSLLPREDIHKVMKISNSLANDSVNEVIKAQKDSKRIRIEMVNDLARRVPLLLTGEYFGFPGPDLKTMYRWSSIGQNHFFHNVLNDPFLKNKANKMGKEMIAYSKKLIVQKKREIQNSKTPEQYDDILSRMIKSGPSEALIDQTSRIEYNIIGLVLASGETTQAAAVNALDEILRRDDVFKMATKAALANDDRLLERIIFEALRYNPQTPLMLRYTEQDYVLAAGTDRETLIPQGSAIMVGNQSAMFDEEFVKNPETFDVNRSEEAYLHFGYGHHKCLGDYLGRIMVTQIIKSLLVKPNLTRVSEVDHKKGPFPERFYLEFDRE